MVGSVNSGRYVANALTLENSNPNSWTNDIRRAFPDWQTETGIARWPGIRDQLNVGQSISGQVIARAPFGVWLDIGCSWPALLLVPNMETARETSIHFDEYPEIGVNVKCRINALGDNGELGVTQLQPDDMIEGDSYAT